MSFNKAKVARKFDLNESEIVDIELLEGKHTDCTLVVWLERLHWANENETERVDSVHNLYTSELEALK